MQYVILTKIKKMFSKQKLIVKFKFNKVNKNLDDGGGETLSECKLRNQTLFCNTPFLVRRIEEGGKKGIHSIFILLIKY